MLAVDMQAIRTHSARAKRLRQRRVPPLQMASLWAFAESVLALQEPGNGFSGGWTRHFCGNVAAAVSKREQARHVLPVFSRRARRIRRALLSYALAIGGNVPRGLVARHLGIGRTRVCADCATLENLREKHPDLDALLDQLADAVADWMQT